MTMAPTKRKASHMSSAKPNKKTSAALPAVSQSTASSTEEKVDGEVTEEWPGWAPVESEPAIFTELIKEFGVKGVVVQDVYSTDEDTMRGFVNAHGIIFLFRHRDNEEVEGDIETTCPEGVWFANQIVENACASLAMLNILANSTAELGATLSAFKEFAAPLTPPMKGLAVANNPHLRNIHNSFARQSECRDLDILLTEQVKTRPFMTAAKPKSKGKGSKKKQAKEEEEEEEDYDDDGPAFHYVAYVHINGALYELDGLQKRPVRVCNCPQSEWTVQVGSTVRERMRRYPKERTFNLLSVGPETGVDVDEDFVEIARRRKVDWEAFVHRALTILGTKKIAQQKL
ncbi:ubiquitin carboxyl-terminal hydrolase [Tricharina praecox]|uniref:ubiquitin carboxyl-terminal hydrolase n=1 Tax=Tricharina praecox TaxID=43433 RepID=UPI00221FA70C|nr:ubiquitin carboxyl-terminal hydrolase [Tricharina praecox]KAI5855224.1 ubiquitin carboxyl-terminal hydrolase [Tricharina praecox]